MIDSLAVCDETTKRKNPSRQATPAIDAMADETLQL
jgi:hypothetical protein